MAGRREDKTKEEHTVSKVKTPEQIAAEIAGNSRKPVIIITLTIVAFGIALVITDRIRTAKNAAIADSYDKLDAIVTNLDFSKIDDEKSLSDKLSKLTTVIEKADPKSASKAAIDATYFKGKYQFDLGKYDAAFKTFEEFYTKHASRTPFAGYARLGAANAKMNLGDAASLATAIKLLDESVGKVTDPQLQDKMRYQMGLCNAMAGNVDKAKKILTQLTKKKNPDGSPGIMNGDAEKLLGLIKTMKVEDMSKMAKEFPKSMVKITPAKKKDSTSKKASK